MEPQLATQLELEKEEKIQKKKRTKKNRGVKRREWMQSKMLLWAQQGAPAPGSSHSAVPVSPKAASIAAVSTDEDWLSFEMSYGDCLLV